MTDYCLTGGRIVDPSQGLDEIRDLWVLGGRVSFKGNESNVERMDVSGKVIMPGLADLRGHLREPESLASASMSAAAGGFTTILIMPDARQTLDNPGAIRLMQENITRHGTIGFSQCGCLTMGSRGDALAPLGSLKEAGVVAVSDCPNSSQNTEIFARGLEYAAMFDLPVIEFPRDLSISEDGIAHDGPTALKMGVGGYPRMAEELFVQRAITVSRNLGVGIHLTSISSGGAVDLIREAKSKNVPITADTTAHHLALTDAQILGYDTNAKTMPPLREDEDRQAIFEGILDGTLDCICTAHEPCHEHEKQVEFDLAPPGVLGYETALSVVYGELSKAEKDPFGLIARLMSETPRRILKLSGPGIAEGEVADFLLFDPAARWTYHPRDAHSQAKNSPFADQELTGSVDMTFALGEKVFHRE